MTTSRARSSRAHLGRLRGASDGPAPAPRPAEIGRVAPWLGALIVGLCALVSLRLAGLIWQALEYLGDILLLFFFGWLLASILEPLAAAVVRWARIPRAAAVGLIYLGLLLVLGLGGALLTPTLVRQTTAVAEGLPTVAEGASGQVSELDDRANGWLRDRQLPLQLDLRGVLSQDSLTSRVEAFGPAILGSALQVATVTASALAGLGLLVLVSAYFLFDGGRLAEQVLRTFPSRVREDVEFVLTVAVDAFVGYLRGQLAQGLIYGIGTWAFLATLTIDNALLGGVAAGLLLLIPVVGPVLAIVVPLTLALLSRPTAVPSLLVLLVVLQQIVINVLAPRLMSRQVGLPPLVVLFALLVGVRIAGLWGAIFSVPMVATATAAIAYWRADGESRRARRAALRLTCRAE